MMKLDPKAIATVKRARPAQPLMDNRPEAQALLANIKTKMPELEALLKRTGEIGASKGEAVRMSHIYEEAVYRFYHESFKVYALQQSIQDIIAALRSLAPERPLNEMFTDIVAQGTGKNWTLEHNRRWAAETRPILEAFFHSLYFLKGALLFVK